MTWTVSFNEQARSELQEAAHYYGLESPTLRVAFLDAIDVALTGLHEQPKSAPVVRGTIRCKPIRRFPYSLLYTLRPGGDSHPGGDAPEPASLLLAGT